MTPVGLPKALTLAPSALRVVQLSSVPSERGTFEIINRRDLRHNRDDNKIAQISSLDQSIWGWGNGVLVIALLT